MGEDWIAWLAIIISLCTLAANAAMYYGGK